MSDEPLGARIAKRRHVLGLKQWELAERVGVSRDTVSMWERGEQFPQRHLGKLEQVLGISLYVSPDGMVPLDEYERELLALKDALPQGQAERLVEMYRDQTGRRRNSA